MSTPTSRRGFLKRGVLSAVVFNSVGLHSFRARASSSPVQRTRAGTIIDTHTHFYDPARPEGVPWPGKDDPLLYRTVLPAHYRALTKPREVMGTVVVEASPWVEDNQWILDLAANDPFIVGLVGNLPVGKPEFRQLLKRFTANRLFLGLRIGGGRLREGLNDARFLADLKSVAAKGLAVDLLGGPEMLPGVAQLARAIPDLRIVIDHVANPRIDGRTPDAAWTDGMRAAAAHRHVYCKVSGLVEGTGRANGDAPREAAFYQPVLDTVWRAFGEDHLVYGSNWPVSERFASCATVQQIVTDYFHAKGSAVEEKYFWRNARAVYRWVPRTV